MINEKWTRYVVAASVKLFQDRKDRVSLIQNMNVHSGLRRHIIMKLHTNPIRSTQYIVPFRVCGC